MFSSSETRKFGKEKGVLQEEKVVGEENECTWFGRRLGGWINCMMEKSPASALTSASKCWEKNGDLHLFLHGEPSSQYLKQKSSKYREQDMGKEKEWNGRRKL